MNSASYVDTISEVWKTRLVESQSLVNRIFSEPFDVDHVVTSNDFESNWRNLIRSQVIVEAMELIDESSSQEKVDSAVEEAFTLVKLGMDDYFKNLDYSTKEIEEYYLNSIAETLNPHTNYFSAEANKVFESELSAERELFGISYIKNRRGELEISEVLFNCREIHR